MKRTNVRLKVEYGVAENWSLMLMELTTRELIEKLIFEWIPAELYTRKKNLERGASDLHMGKWTTDYSTGDSNYLQFFNAVRP